MASQPTPSYTRLANAIIIAAVLVSATLYAAIDQAPKTVTSTATSTITVYRTATTTVTNNSSSASNATAQASTMCETATAFYTYGEGQTGPEYSTSVFCYTVTTTDQASVTGNFTNASDTYLTSCSVTGIGGFQFLIVSDSTNAPIVGETINAVDQLGCDAAGQPSETQTVYLDNFSVGQGGWLTPVFPSRAEPGGDLNITVTYQGITYNFSATVPSIGTSCVTLHVPSDNVTTATVMNGEGSYCWQ